MKDETKKGGIYKIVNLVNGKIYIGSATYLKSRKSEHFNRLRKHEHHNQHLQRAFDKYGEENFKFEIIEYVDDKEKLIEREQYWLDKTQCYNKDIGYNKRTKADSCIGLYLSDETKQKISIANTGKKRTPEQTQKNREANTGKKQSQETIDKRVQKLTGQKRTKLFKEQLSQDRMGSSNPGSKLTEDDVIIIKQMLAQGINQSIIANKFNIVPSAISNIKNNKSWIHVELPNILNNDIKNIKYYYTLKENDVKEIKQMLIVKKTLKEIADKFHVTIGTISGIKCEHTWKQIQI
jgi:group I intron endonuclease